MVINRATIADVPEIVALHRRCVLEENSKIYSKEAIAEWVSDVNEENTREQMVSGTSVWITARLGKDLVGFAQYTFESNEIYQMNVKPELQGRRVGTALYKYIEQDFVQNGVKQISLRATLNAVGFYEKLGFINLGIIKVRLKNETNDMIKMDKSLP